MATGNTDRKKIMVCFGTRPEAIKMCPLVLELLKREEALVSVCVTGQHREMLDSVLRVFGVKPDADLKIMKERQTLFDVTRGILDGMENVLDSFRPDIVLVHGDTTTAFACALACFYKKIPIGHVEAGLRTGDIYSPFPEEFNRSAVSLVAKYHFSPTAAAKDNLVREGHDPDSIFVTGNTVIDAMKTTVRSDYSHPVLDWVDGRRMLLVTAHRRENLGAPLRSMFRAIRRVVVDSADTVAVYPVHPNPEVRSLAYEILGDCERIRLIEPLDVLDFHNFLASSYLVLTDSGGIQEEAPSLGKPVLVMRNTTERPEGVEAGTLRLVGTDEENIYSNAMLLLDNNEQYGRMSRAVNPYGDGRACERIADVLLSRGS